MADLGEDDKDDANDAAGATRTCRRGHVNPVGRKTCRSCGLRMGEPRTTQIPVPVSGLGSAPAFSTPGPFLDPIVVVLPNFGRVTISPGDVLELRRHTDDQVVFEALQPFTGVSREAHAVLSFDPDGPRIKDAHPQGNGTFLNGVRLGKYQSLPVAPGDLIRLGPDCNLKVEESHGNG